MDRSEEVAHAHRRVRACAHKHTEQHTHLSGEAGGVSPSPERSGGEEGVVIRQIRQTGAWERSVGEEGASVVTISKTFS
jgi:hypothetical protein